MIDLKQELGEAIDDTDSSTNLDVSNLARGVGVKLSVSPENYNKHSQFDLADAFHALESSQVALSVRPHNPIAVEWWKEFFDMPSTAALRSSSVGNPAIAQSGAIDLADKLASYVQQELKAPPNETELQKFSRRSRSIREAIKAATDAADNAKQLVDAMSYGLVECDPSTLNDDQFNIIFNMLKRSRRLREILEIAGQMLHFKTAQRKKRIEGHDFVAGVTQSGELSRLLPSEIMCLAHPDLEDDMLRRLVERQALSLDKYAEEKVGKGPVVVVIDESSSMGSDSRIEQAKAFALVMAKQAARDKRWVQFVSFSYNGNRPATQLFKPDEWPRPETQVRLLKYIQSFLGGGTDFNVLSWVADNWKKVQCPKGKTDVYFITDTSANLSDWLIEKFNTWKQDNDVKCYGLAVSSEVGCLPLVCDQAWSTSTMGLESSAVREILSK